MTTTTTTEIDLDPIPRMKPAQIDTIRTSVAKSRWLVRVTTWGDFVLGRDRKPFGLDTDVIVVQPPALGASLAGSCIGLPLNFARRLDDQTLTHVWPDGPGRIHSARGFQPWTAGVVESCWPDEFGLVATVLVWGPGYLDLHEELTALEGAGLVSLAGVCLAANVRDAWITKTPFSATVAVIREARGISLDLMSTVLRPGARFLRRLEMDEDPRRDVPPPDERIVPQEWLTAVTLGSPHSGDVEPGNVGVGTANLTANAVTEPVSEQDTAGTYSNSTTSHTTVVEKQITTAGEALLIIGSGSFLIANDDPTPPAVRRVSGEFQLTRDSTTLNFARAGGPLLADNDPENADIGFFPVTVIASDAPAAGTYTYKLQAKCENSDMHVSLGRSNSARIQIVRLKR